MESVRDQDELAKIFRRKHDIATSDWGGCSGGGSDPYRTIEYRAFVDKFARMNQVRSIVDVGCGDWQFSRFLISTEWNTLVWMSFLSY